MSTAAPLALELHRAYLYAQRRGLVSQWTGNRASLQRLAPRMRAIRADCERLERLRQINDWFWTQPYDHLHRFESEYWHALEHVQDRRRTPIVESLGSRGAREVTECDCTLRGGRLPFRLRDQPFSSMPVINYFASPARSRVTRAAQQVCHVLEHIWHKRQD